VNHYFGPFLVTAAPAAFWPQPSKQLSSIQVAGMRQWQVLGRLSLLQLGVSK
jgi:hypothetical protein